MCVWCPLVLRAVVLKRIPCRPPWRFVTPTFPRAKLRWWVLMSLTKDWAQFGSKFPCRFVLRSLRRMTEIFLPKLYAIYYSIFCGSIIEISPASCAYGRISTWMSKFHASPLFELWVHVTWLIGGRQAKKLCCGGTLSPLCLIGVPKPGEHSPITHYFCKEGGERERERERYIYIYRESVCVCVRGERVCACVSGGERERATLLSTTTLTRRNFLKHTAKKPMKTQQLARSVATRSPETAQVCNILATCPEFANCLKNTQDPKQAKSMDKTYESLPCPPPGHFSPYAPRKAWNTHRLDARPDKPNPTHESIRENRCFNEFGVSCHS